jgi:hypothetical protein
MPSITAVLAYLPVAEFLTGIDFQGNNTMATGTTTELIPGMRKLGLTQE